MGRIYLAVDAAAPASDRAIWEIGNNVCIFNVKNPHLLDLHATI